MNASPYDRTAEFFNTVKSYERSLSSESSTGEDTQQALLGDLNQNRSNGFTRLSPTNNNSNDPVQQKSQFTKAAGHISRGIFGIASKLEHLTKLARKRSLYEDKSAEINEVTYVIKKDLETLNQELDVLQNFVENRNAQTQSSSNNTVIVSSLKQKLADTTKEFASVLQTRTKNLKEQNSRRKNFETTGPKLPKRELRSFGMFPESPTENGAGVDLEGGEGAEAALQLMAPQEDSYLDSRAEAVENIERTIGELGQMYQKLISIVDMQRDVTIRIDENVDNTLNNVQAGTNQLMEHLNSLSSSKWLIIKIFMILIAFSIFFTIFVA